MEEIRRPDNMERITTPELAQAFIDEQLAALRGEYFELVRNQLEMGS